MFPLNRKYFKGILNADDSIEFVGEDEFVNAENVRFGTTDAGVTGTIESVLGTVLKSSPEPSVTHWYHGGAEDTESSRFAYFLYDIYGSQHKIRCYSAITDTIYDVLLSSQVQGGLNFHKDYYIHSARIVNSILYWTDNYNQPRRVNIDAGINMNHPGTVSGVTAYTSPLESSIITIIRKPPNYSPSVLKTANSRTNNFISTFSGKFSAYYDFRDGENSVLSAYSKLVSYNTMAEDTTGYDTVQVTLSFAEIIPQDVQRVNIAVQIRGDIAFFTVKTWDKNNSSDASAIAAHNAGTTALTFNFYNDQTGIALGDAFSVKQFDSVPRNSEALEIAKNRIKLGNNLEGYDTPTTTSLTATLDNQTAGTTVQGSVFKLVYGGGANTRYVVYLPGAAPGYYRYTANDTILPPDPVAFSALTFISSDTTMVFRYYVPTWPSTPIDSFTFQNYITITGTPSVLLNQICYKSGAPYKLAVWFFDKWMRKCGVITNGQTYETADRTYAAAAFTVGLNWTLNNTNTLQEIPDWAEYYTVGRTRCLRTNFFLQARSKNAAQSQSMIYVNRDTSNNYTFTTNTYASTLVGVGINITNLQNFGMGYVYSEGDIVKVYISASVYSMKIIGQSGQWIIAELQDLGSLSSTTDALFEIYTPYLPSINEAFYEIGNIYSIVNPGTVSRQYSILSDSIRGDVILLNRGTSPSDYLTENMSPNDKYYTNWFTDAGRPNFIDYIGQQRKKTNISWSNVLIPGTRTNGLSSFDALDERNIPEECGPIQKLILTSKVQDEQGTVMLAICEKETASLYLGETQQYGSATSTTITVSTDVIGTINILKGSFGTVNPESVTEYRGNVFWYDAGNGKYIQYSSNGLFPISNYKLTKFWKLFSDQYLSMTPSEIEALGNRPYVFSVVDPHHDELLVSVPRVLATPPKGYLPDYPSVVYPFDIWDGQGKTLVFKLGVSEPHWQSSYSFVSEGFVTLQNKLFSFKNGFLYLHNQTSSSTFYNIPFKARVMFAANQNPQFPKVFSNISVQSNIKPTLTYFRSEVPYIQASDLMDFDYNTLEGFYYATLYRNRLVPTATGFNTNGLVTAEKIRTHALRILVEFPVTPVQLELRFINVGLDKSKGHNL